MLGSERALRSGVEAYGSDGQKITIPTGDSVRLKMVAVAFGAQPDFILRGNSSASLYSFSGSSFEDVMAELDTFLDFTKYLDEVTQFASTHQIISDGGDWGLLCKYLLGGRTFLDDGKLVQLLENRWTRLKTDARYLQKK
ncbi:MAG: hypothetical protein H7Y17_13095 [Chlorobia bacterium]|nr:hypothetical protein [Fimbriimonadaceae bacterium]